MAKAKKTTEVIQLPVQAQRTEADLITAMRNFAMASVDVIDISRTVDVLEFLTNKITDSPESYHKITKPETVAKFREVLENQNGKMPGPFELVGLMSTFNEIFA